MSVGACLHGAPEPGRSMLRELRSALCELLSDATEALWRPLPYLDVGRQHLSDAATAQQGSRQVDAPAEAPDRKSVV